MKITFFIGGLSGGGAERVICNLANYLSEKDNECVILTMSEEESTYELLENIKVKSLLANRERKNFILDNVKRLVRLKKYMKNTNVDIYIVFLPITIIMMLLLKKSSNARIIASERGNPKRYSWVVQRMLKVLAKRADKWVFQTTDAMDWYKNVISEFEIIPNAINKEFVCSRYEGERRKVIIGAGRLSEQKNFSLLIQAFSDVADYIPDYSLEIYGEGNKRKELEQLVKKCGIEKKVKMPGYVKSLGETIKDASLFVLSSNYEGMPNSLMEAMALGIPCISTDCPVGGPRYLIKDNVNGCLVPVGDKERLANAILSLLSDKEKSSQMGRLASKIVDDLSPEKIYSRWNEIIIN
ncbi:glycosyltransferase family 4 protein [Enterococcus faecium]|nr:glycosyltransferase family 4 protein [Enterococcus faecium]